MIKAIIELFKVAIFCTSKVMINVNLKTRDLHAVNASFSWLKNESIMFSVTLTVMKSHFQIFSLNRCTKCSQH